MATPQLEDEAAVPPTVPRCRDNLGEAMERAKMNGIELEYEMKGSGEPLLLISPVVAASVRAIHVGKTLVDHFRLVRYHRRGWGESTHSAPPVRVADHASDAAALLELPRHRSRARRRTFQRWLRSRYNSPSSGRTSLHTLALFEPSSSGTRVPGVAPRGRRLPWKPTAAETTARQ